MKNNLSLTLNAQFFTPKKKYKASVIRGIVDAAIGNMPEGEVPVFSEFRIKRTEVTKDVAYKYSLYVFPTERQVYFLTNTPLKDTIYGFILLLEFDGYLVIVRKSCDNIYPEIDKNFEVVSSEMLTSTVKDDLANFQKISIRNMTVSDKAIRSRSYEAVDLKGALSVHAAGRSIPYFVKLREGSSLTTMSLNAGRVHEASARRSLNEMATWANAVIEKISSGQSTTNFLHNFAKKVELNQVLKNSKPIALLVECGALKDKIDGDQLGVFYKNKKGQIVSLGKVNLNKLYKAFEEVYEIDPQSMAVKHAYRNANLVLNSKSMTLRIKSLGRVYVCKNGKYELIHSFISKHGFFSVCFDDPKFMYFMGECFEDASGISEIENLLKILVPVPGLMSVTAEKGSFTKANQLFDSSSVFDVIEKHHARDTYLLCDDLGDEWADHISLDTKQSCITFIHSKHGDVSASASNMHDVVGQAIKNVGNMFFDSTRFIEKSNKKFKNVYPGTSIQRYRNGTSGALKKDLENLLADHRLHRKCVLACSFISKKQITAEFKKISSGKAVKGNVIQLLWIISSFSHALREASVVPLIYCRP